MKRLLIIVFLAATCLIAKPQVSVTILPQSYFVEKIAGDTLDVNVMVPPGADPHIYEPKPKQMLGLEKSDIYFTIGLELEKAWIEKFSNSYPSLIISKSHKGIKRIAMQEHSHDHDGHKHDDHDHHGHKHDDHKHDGHEHCDHDHDKKDAKKHKHDDHDHSEHKHDDHDGHEHCDHGHDKKDVKDHKHDDHDDHKHCDHKHDNHDHDKKDVKGHDHDKKDVKGHEHDDHGHSHAHHGHSHGDLDEHVWLDPILAIQIGKNIYKQLSKTYPQNADLYLANFKKFEEECLELDKTIKDRLKGLKNRKFIVYHPSWGYYAKRYNLEQIAIEIDGKEPKIADLANLIKEAKEENVKVIFVQPQFSTKSAKEIAKETSSKVISIDPLSKDWKNEMIKTTEIFGENLK